jgi:hypothetical protein
LAGNQQAQQTEIHSMELITAVIRKRQDSRERFTVDQNERVRLLFERGYSYCKEKRHDLCESAMRKVVKLSPRHKNALRLQAWASLQKSALEPTPLPQFENNFAMQPQDTLEPGSNPIGSSPPDGGGDFKTPVQKDAGGDP